MGTMKPASSCKIFLAFGLGILAGAAAMFCAGVLYLRHNLVLREEFPGVTADDLDDVLEHEFPAGTGCVQNFEFLKVTPDTLTFLERET